MTTTAFNRKVSKTEKKIPNASSLMTTTVLNRKISKAENKASNLDK